MSWLRAQGATALFGGLVVYYAAITTSQYWQGKPGVSEGLKSPGSVSLVACALPCGAGAGSAPSPGWGGRERGQGEPVGTHPAEPRQSSAIGRNLSSPGVANERLAKCKGSPPAPAGPCVNEVPAGPGVPFPGTNNPGESKKQSWQVSWLQNHPSLDFHYFQLPFKNEKPEEGRVPWESSLGPWVSGGFCSTKITLCCGSLVPWRPPPAGSGGTFVHRLRILHAPLAPFLIRVG